MNIDMNEEIILKYRDGLINLYDLVTGNAFKASVEILGIKESSVKKVYRSILPECDFERLGLESGKVVSILKSLQVGKETIDNYIVNIKPVTSNMYYSVSSARKRFNDYNILEFDKTPLKIYNALTKPISSFVNEHNPETNNLYSDVNTLVEPLTHLVDTLYSLAKPEPSNSTSDVINDDSKQYNQEPIRKLKDSSNKDITTDIKQEYEFPDTPMNELNLYNRSMKVVNSEPVDENLTLDSTDSYSNDVNILDDKKVNIEILSVLDTISKTIGSLSSEITDIKSTLTGVQDEIKSIKMNTNSVPSLPSVEDMTLLTSELENKINVVIDKVNKLSIQETKNTVSQYTPRKDNNTNEYEVEKNDIKENIVTEKPTSSDPLDELIENNNSNKGEDVKQTNSGNGKMNIYG